MSSERGDVTFSRLASYSSAMPVSSRLSLSSYTSQSGFSPRGAGYRASSLERGGYSPLSSKLSSRLSSTSGYSRRPPLPTGDQRRRHEGTPARASPARSTITRRDGSTEPDALTEARRYLQERRDRLTRSESREPSGSLRSLLASEGAGRLLERLDTTGSGSETRRWRAGESQSRERLVPITLERQEAARTAGQLRRQLDAARTADPAAEEAAVTKEGGDRVVGGRTAEGSAAAFTNGLPSRQRTTPATEKVRRAALQRTAGTRHGVGCRCGLSCLRWFI